MNIQYNEIEVLQSIAKQPIYNADATHELHSLASTYSWFGLAHILYAKANVALQQENDEALSKVGMYINQPLWLKGFLSNTNFETVCEAHIGLVKKETAQFDYNAEAKEGIIIEKDMSWDAANQIDEGITNPKHQANEMVPQENSIDALVDYLPTNISLDEEVIAEDNVLLSMHEDKGAQEDDTIITHDVTPISTENQFTASSIDETVAPEYQIAETTNTFSSEEHTFTANTHVEDNVLLAVHEETLATTHVDELVEKIAETPIIDAYVVTTFNEDESDEISDKATAQIEALQHDTPVVAEFDSVEATVSDKAALQIEALNQDEPVVVDYDSVDANTTDVLSDKANQHIKELDKDTPVAPEYDYGFYKEVLEDKQAVNENIKEDVVQIEQPDVSNNANAPDATDEVIETTYTTSAQEIEALSAATIAKAIHYIPRPPANIYAQPIEAEVQEAKKQEADKNIIENPSQFERVTEQQEPNVEHKQIPLPKVADNEIDKEGTLSFEPYHTVDYFAAVGIKIDEKLLQNDRIGQQLKSFTDWLKTMKALHPEKLVDTSLQNDTPAIEIRTIEDEEVITEAMALVYHKQGRSDKAIELLNKLSLLNPSKSAYFANQIEQIKNKTI
jgi:hypothetical protein